MSAPAPLSALSALTTLRGGLALVAGALVAIAAACAGEEAVTQDVVSVIPWPDTETARYVLREREGGGEEKGRGALSVQRDGDRYRLGLRFEDGVSSDESSVLVDGETLKPLSMRREIVGPDETTVLESRYEDELVRITARSDGRERSNPLRLKEHYYDNESSLFLWRTLRFEEGYRASYHAVMVNRRKQQVVRVEVVGRESVTVPAGTFQAWRIEVRSGGVEQVAWYADTATRPLVKYDNSELLFLLTELPGGEATRGLPH
ncbi:MAG: DUF3108 domain-containing protein [Dehalococcoidia bacterium]